MAITKPLTSETINLPKPVATPAANSRSRLIFQFSFPEIGLIEKNVNGKKKRYGFISTGNFNEDTAKIYTDYTLLTSNQKILKEVNKVFNFLQVHYKLKKYKHLIVSPHYTHNTVVRMINQEIENHKAGLPSGNRLKLNAITNFKMIEKL